MLGRDTEAVESLCGGGVLDVPGEFGVPNFDVRPRRRDQMGGGVEGTAFFAAGVHVDGDLLLGSSALRLEVPPAKAGVTLPCDGT